MRAYNKSIIREIKSSKARFISILIIILLGVAFYAGIKATGPNMANTIEIFYKEQNLMDAKIVSSLGLNDEDLNLLENNDSILQYQGYKTIDLNLTNINKVVRFMEYDENIQNPINEFVALEGRLPQKSGEIALDEYAFKTNSDLKIGDIYIIGENDSINKESFEIVGMVKSPMYIENRSKGTTTVGKGTVDYFAVLNSEDINLDVYTEIYVIFKNVVGLNAYSDEYKNKMEENNEYLENLYKDRIIKRVEEVKLDALEELDEPIQEVLEAEKDLQKAKIEIEDAKLELSSGQSEYEKAKSDYEKEIKNAQNLITTNEKSIEDGLKELENNSAYLSQEQINEAKEKFNVAKAEIEKAKEELESSKVKGQNELNKAKAKLEDAKEEIQKGEKEIEENLVKLEDAKAEIDDAKEEIEKISGKYYFFDRNDNPGYSEYSDVVKRMDSIATVFPMFFFIVAILICLTTMTRMVEENRTEIGTLKALGYSNIEISKKYIVYALIASVVGSIFGVIIGYNVFPPIIYVAYRSQYTLPDMNIVYYLSFIIQGALISILCTVGAAMLVLKVDLNSQPSVLMRPKAPKIGKKILLERIKPIWDRLNFNQKVTCRNLFRYKQRMIMTIFGIAACTAMMITGFGLQDSINGIADKQFNKLWNYQAIVTFEDEFTQEEDEEYNEALINLEGFIGKLDVHQEMINFTKEGMNKQNVTLYIPKNKDELNNFVLLNDRVSSKEYTLSENGVIISEKLSKLLEVKKGDVITLNDEDNDSYDVVVDNIIESYVSHSMYMSKDYYEKIIGKDLIFNSQLISVDIDLEDEQIIAETLMECDKVINVTLTSKLETIATEAMDSLDIVIVILIISAGGLALVVLYNLNNINVSERIRELSTIKVLGFYDREVTMYILRENSILTIFGIFAGVFMGKILHIFVSKTAEQDNMMFSPNIYPRSFIYAIALTLLFSSIVMIMMHRKLKKIDMIDALKSNE